MQKLCEAVKVDMGLVGQTISATNATGRYYSMAKYRKALFVMVVGALAATKTCKVEVLQATDGAASDAKAISGKSAIITANTKVIEATVALASAANTDTVTINGLKYTMAAATDATAREFADAAGLVTCVNNATYGVTGVTASASSTTVTLKSTNAGEVYITVAGGSVAGTVTVATTKAIAYVEVDASEMDTDDDFTHIAAKVTSTGAGIDGVVLLRGNSRFNIEQIVGASAA